MTAPAGGARDRAVALRGLHKAFGPDPALRGVDLDIPAGSVSAILGPSGSGKTTLLRLLAGFDRPDAGTITVGGATMDGPGVHVAPARRAIGYVPQEGALFPHLDVRANIGFGLPRAARRARVAELMELTGLDGLAARYPHQLSGGQQQRVALARALAPDPTLVLLDEPFSSLDAFLRTSVRMDVLRILRRSATTTLLVTHDQSEALSMADQVAVLRDGRVAQVGAPDEIYRRPADPELAAFVGDANLLAGTVTAGPVIVDRATTGRGAGVVTRLGHLELAVGGLDPGCEVVVLVRPEQVHLVDRDQPAAVPGRVVQRDYHGHDILAAVEVADPAGGVPLTVSLRGSDAAELSPGAAVSLAARGTVMAWLRPAPGPAAVATGAAQDVAADPLPTAR